MTGSISHTALTPQMQKEDRSFYLQYIVHMAPAKGESSRALLWASCPGRPGRLAMVACRVSRLDLKSIETEFVKKQALFGVTDSYSWSVG